MGSTESERRSGRPEYARSEQLYRRASGLFPAGVNSPVRAFKAVGGDPLFFQRAEGAYLYDVDNNRYIDYVCSWGAIMAGHAHPHVVEAVARAAEKGLSFGASHEGEIRLAEEIVQRYSALEKLRFVNSGTEATMSAVRLARGATGRELLVKFDGCYHGHADYLLVKAGSGLATFGNPDSAGVTASAARDTLVVPFNDIEGVNRLFAEKGDQIAAVIVEPVAGNMGVVPPAPGFLEALRDLTHDSGALLIFDEVMTGFRVDKGSACALYGVIPDLVCLAKVIGGGMPVGAYGGSADLMNNIAPLGPVYQAGTLSGNPVGMAAGLATLELLTDEAYQRCFDCAAALEAGLVAIFRDLEVPAVVQRVGAMLSVYFTEDPVNTTAAAMATDREYFGRLFTGLLAEGVNLPPSPLEAWFLSAAHSEADIEHTVEAVRRVAESLKQ